MTVSEMNVTTLILRLAVAFVHSLCCRSCRFHRSIFASPRQSCFVVIRQTLFVLHSKIPLTYYSWFIRPCYFPSWPIGSSSARGLEVESVHHVIFREDSGTSQESLEDRFLWRNMGFEYAIEIRQTSRTAETLRQIHGPDSYAKD